MQKRNRVRGLKAKRSGDQFENLIVRSCDYYKRTSIAYIQKTPEPMKVIAVLDMNKGHFRAHYEKKAQPDFSGTLKDGRSIVFEAKHTTGTSLPFDRINKQQEIDLALHDELDAWAGVVISFSMKNFYCVPYYAWNKLKETSGKKSVNQKDLEIYKITVEGGLLKFLEWMKEVEQ
ncbi:hypothetical protein BKP56_09175 [Marinilactibacillus sp. 15R]|uniref:Holliday junction resolvase RecU n=1 Tax=Marinilactibacillus sp. 15R TaxID=1911586 RepID=UPI0009095215|nr:Holliday junction resolvase RecU [Marinilactibacillus sp. 15R]API89415.1 hypothetical protein BKP56_09175 [Marinilactibacillus sp. 15R]